MSHWSRMPDALKEQVFKRLELLASVANLSEENRIAYDKAVDRYYVNRIVEEDMRREWEEKYKKGMEEYLEKGKQQGLQQGLLSTAYNLKKMGLSVEQVVQATGLTAEEVENI